jgi:VanZ family protein
VNRPALTAAARASLAVTVAAVLYLATTDRSFPVIELVWDKAKHASAFAVLALLLDFSFPATRFGTAKIAALLGFGILIEVIQYFLPYRDASALDVGADSVGIALYALCLPLLLRARVLQRAAKG